MAAVVKAHPDVVSCDLVGAAALLKLETSTYYTLNDVGSRIWYLLQRPTAISDICDDVLAHYDVEASRCYRDVVVLLRELSDAGLVEIVDPGPDQVPGSESA
jgi:hypothetical protein